MEATAGSSQLAFRFPGPYGAACYISSESSGSNTRRLQIVFDDETKISPTLREDFICDDFIFTISPGSTASPDSSDNTAWTLARLSPLLHASSGKRSPPINAIWTMVYAVFSCLPDLELFRLKVSGEKEDSLKRDLLQIGLAISHPIPSGTGQGSSPEGQEHEKELIVTRASFWQGAGSPFGPIPLWLVGPHIHSQDVQEHYPARPLQYTMTTGFPQTPVHTRHPFRPPKPKPGSIIYSRYIPHLDEMFSMVALDWTNEEHVNYFHEWQNDPRVAEGWKQTGSVEEHRAYLHKVHDDPHQFTVLGLFDGTPFAYFEIYWAKEDHVGAYYDAQDYDRGRHYLVGDARFRGPHRVQAWHSSLTHYMFLDDPRTNSVVGEPKASRPKPLMYDQMHGYHVEKHIDLPHKRAALIKCSRERFFQLMPFDKRTERGESLLSTA